MRPHAFVVTTQPNRNLEPEAIHIVSRAASVITHRAREAAADPVNRPLTMEWISSLLFWTQLLIAVALYAVVSLSPKLMMFVNLRTDYVKAQSQLINLEQQVEELKKVVTALEGDPRILNELARIEVDASRPGEQSITLSPELTLQSRITQQRVHTPDVALAWYEPLLATFVENRQLRTTCLSVAAALILLSFTFFQPSDLTVNTPNRGVIRSSLVAFLERYSRRK